MKTIKKVIKNGISHPETELVGIEILSDANNYYCKESVNDSAFDKKKEDVMKGTNTDEPTKIDLSTIDIDSLTDEQIEKLKNRLTK